MAPHFLVHESGDTVGVVVVEGIEPGQELDGWVMDIDETVTIEATDPIPLGHKIALMDFGDGDTVIKYGHDIGKVVEPCAKGGHIHVHNMKTKRW
ncbi:MAG: UxaA family hydrolase [Alphaproteobacteria bacterium]